ncbi:MAG: hypothetical protein A2Z18_04280 [Armatimonadetes bacterium RBG_16_58_9]|nr:MAG: hypothetical protein A2Z18_04280 [Armatimonadetes bacterium RBG_16_58_9]
MVDSTAAQQPTKVLIVQEYRMVTEMVANLLSSQSWIEVVQAVGSLAEAKEALSRSNPHVLLTDTALPDGSGIEWARQVKQDHPGIKIIFLTAADVEDTALAAIGTGAEGYLVERSTCQNLVDAIRSVMSGDCVFDPSLTASIVRRFAADRVCAFESPVAFDLDQLSAREREIAELVSEGLTNDEIAKAAFVSVNTVKTHLRRIYQRLGISSRRQLLHHHRLS